MKQFYETYRDADKKLSSLLREIIPSSGRSFRDRYVMDFLGKKTYVDEYSMKQAIIAKIREQTYGTTT